ncbi:MAG: OmpA family protein [Gammaproteobacteria bacterium]|nr:OmpA family protein [Gammaproteobacteria bacterium]
MNKGLKLIAAACLLSLLAGCSTTGGHRDTRFICALVGGVVGGGLGTIATDNDEAEIGIAAGIIGAGLGYLACPQRDEGPAPIIDGDGDGVPDGSDACPATPRGTPVDARGCPLDSDGDGVVDGQDRCPGTPAGTRVDSTGCVPDSDGDGVADFTDQCPATPRGTPVDGRGCPQAGQRVLSLEGVTFGYDSAALTDDARSTLNQAVMLLRENSGLRVRVEGHTDSRGSDAYNLALSQRRAQAVVDYLTSQGISGSRMVAEGFGESRPVAPNDSAANMARNRRVDFVAID